MNAKPLSRAMQPTFSNVKAIRHIARFLLRLMDEIALTQSMTRPWMEGVIARTGFKYDEGTIQYVKDFLQAEHALKYAIVMLDEHQLNGGEAQIYALEAENALLKQKLQFYESAKTSPR
jgi:hypothetical protein